MWYSLSVMIGDGKGSFWCGTEGKYMSSEPTSRARAGPGEEEEEEEKSSATRFELGGPKGALRFDEATPSPGGSATAAAQGTAAKSCEFQYPLLSSCLFWPFRSFSIESCRREHRLAGR